jgi:hypothetical protein
VKIRMHRGLMSCEIFFTPRIFWYPCPESALDFFSHACLKPLIFSAAVPMLRF